MSQDHQFHTTRWSRVLAAKGSSTESKMALSELCEVYYEPVHTFIRVQENIGENDSRDLTHAFFASILARDSLGNVEPAQGKKFRSYLLGAAKNFLSDQRRKNHAYKRGGDQTHQSLDEDDPEVNPIADKPVVDEPFFDRQWSYALLNRTLEQLSQEVPDQDQLNLLKPWLNGDNPKGLTQADVATQLGMTEGAVKVAIHRLRKKLRDKVRAEIAHTLENPTESEIDIELNFLIRSLVNRC